MTEAMTARKPEIRWMRVLYEAGFLIFVLFYLPFFLMKAKHRYGFLCRLGFVPAPVRKSLEGKKVIWVHAVSVGEVVQAVRLINALKEKFTAFKFLLTTTTAAGYEVAQKMTSEEEAVSFFPIDLTWCLRRFIRDVRPSAVVILETEIWPNLIYELSDRGIPAFIVNGRISDKAIGSYRKIRFFMKDVLSFLSGIAVQDEGMRQRFLELGADQALLSVTGNMKYDWQPQTGHEEMIQKIESFFKSHDSFLWICGSTHEGEEEILLDVYQAVKKSCPALRLLVAPRHLNRIESVERKASQKGIFVKRVSSALVEVPRSGHEAEGVWILDQMGLLASLYRAADAVFIGGSLVNFGGHNLAEPAFFEKAILFGPFMQNFKEMAEAFKIHEAAMEVDTGGDLQEKLLLLIRDEERRKAMGRRARQLVFQHQGATHRNRAALLKTIELV